MENKLEKFSPLVFLSSLGAGGLSIAFFAFVNYTLEHGKGLIKLSQTHTITSGFIEAVYTMMESGMAVFAMIHIVLSVYFFRSLFVWLKSEKYQELLKNPLANSAIFAPFISITMTMNVFLASVRYFIPGMADNLQSLMLPGLIMWSLIWIALLRMEIKVLKISFLKGFDLNKIHFGWLLQPFALGMVTVTGAGIAAMAANKTIADIAAFMLLISGSMGLFLLFVKLTAIFKSQFSRDGLGEKQFLPSLLIIVPNITIYAISLFRFGHYLEHHYGAHLGNYFMVLMTLSLAFETWYMLFGLSMLDNYFKRHLKSEFHISQWGLICPFVAYAVLGSFVYNLFLTNIFFFWFIIGVVMFTVVLFSFLLKKQYYCMRQKSGTNEVQTQSLLCS